MFTPIARAACPFSALFPLHTRCANWREESAAVNPPSPHSQNSVSGLSERIRAPPHTPRSPKAQACSTSHTDPASSRASVYSLGPGKGDKTTQDRLARGPRYPRLPRTAFPEYRSPSPLSARRPRQAAYDPARSFSGAREGYSRMHDATRVARPHPDSTLSAQ